MEDEMMRDLFERGIVYIAGLITEQSAERFCRTIVWLNAAKRTDEIELRIDSNGGSVVAALQMYEAIRYSKIPVKGVVERRAFSSAAIVLQACHQRVAFSSAELLFHDTTAEIVVSDTNKDIEKKIEQARGRQKKFHQIIAKRMGRPIEEAAKFSRLEMRMSALEALERGLLDDVIELIP